VEARRGNRADDARDQQPKRAGGDEYLSEYHYKHPESGCPVAALGPELARGQGPANQAFGKAVRARLAWLGELASAKTKAKSRRQATGTYATMVGALIISRALGDAEEAEKYLAQVRQFLRDSLDAGK
jgi:TetR/AcrR family transcriptional repressor of nem operon